MRNDFEQKTKGPKGAKKKKMTKLEKAYDKAQQLMYDFVQSRDNKANKETANVNSQIKRRVNHRVIQTKAEETVSFLKENKQEMRTKIKENPIMEGKKIEEQQRRPQSILRSLLNQFSNCSSGSNKFQANQMSSYDKKEKNPNFSKIPLIVPVAVRPSFNKLIPKQACKDPTMKPSLQEAVQKPASPPFKSTTQNQLQKVRPHDMPFIRRLNDLFQKILSQLKSSNQSLPVQLTTLVDVLVHSSISIPLIRHSNVCKFLLTVLEKVKIDDVEILVLKYKYNIKKYWKETKGHENNQRASRALAEKEARQILLLVEAKYSFSRSQKSSGQELSSQARAKKIEKSEANDEPQLQKFNSFQSHAFNVGNFGAFRPRPGAFKEHKQIQETELKKPMIETSHSRNFEAKNLFGKLGITVQMQDFMQREQKYDNLGGDNLQNIQRSSLFSRTAQSHNLEGIQVSQLLTHYQSINTVNTIKTFNINPQQSRQSQNPVDFSQIGEIEGSMVANLRKQVRKKIFNRLLNEMNMESSKAKDAAISIEEKAHGIYPTYDCASKYVNLIKMFFNSMREKSQNSHNLNFASLSSVHLAPNNSQNTQNNTFLRIQDK